MPSKQNKINEENFISIIEPIALKINEVFKSDSMGLNSDGGIGYALSKTNEDKTEDNIHIWFDDKNEIGIDVCDFNIEDYKSSKLILNIQIEIEDLKKIKVFNDDVENAIEYYRANKI